MRKIIYTITIIFLLSSCKSIDKMVESGNYDGALRYGVNKLRGQKNKKTKYVKGLEKAYDKLNHRDKNEINHLKNSGIRNSHDRIVDIYRTMEDRQNYILPLLPLISEDGYLADIKIIDYSKPIKESSLAASENHYLLGLKYLDIAKEKNDKVAARNAYRSFEESQFYFGEYKDTYERKNEAYNLGQTSILIESYAKRSNIEFDHTLDIIQQININKLNTKWEKYYLQDNESIEFNYIATIEINDIVPGRERERINSFTETKQIKDGKIPIKGEDGIILKDTSGNILYTDLIKEVSAYINEVEREKIAHMNGSVVIIDAMKNIHINTIPINVTYEFRDYSCTFMGDKRALTESTFNRIKDYCDPFPTDYEITSSLAHTYKVAAEASIQKETF